MNDGWKLCCGECGTPDADPVRRQLAAEYEVAGWKCQSRPGDGEAQALGAMPHDVVGAGVFYVCILGVLVPCHIVGMRLVEGFSWKLKAVVGALFYGVIAFAAWKYPAAWRPLMRIPSPPLAAALTVAIAPAVTLMLALVYSKAVSVFIEVPNLLEERSEAGFPLFLSFIDIAILPPIFEEIAFRGVILSKLCAAMPAREAVVISSAMFALMHFDILGTVFFLFPLAVIASVVTLRTKSILPAMAIHFAHNATVFFIDLAELK